MERDKEGRFSNQVAVITGGAGDIGSAAALRLAEEGAAIALLDINEQDLLKRENTLKERGFKTKSFLCNVTDAKMINDVFQRVHDEFGSVDLLFNNAGYQGLFTGIQEYPDDDFEAVIRINLIGVFYVLKAAAKYMIRQKFGRIVNAASMAGVEGPPNMAAYGASKFGVIGLTEAASKDLAPYNIRVNAISPAFMGPGRLWERQVELQAKAGSQYYSTDPKRVEEQMIGSIPMRRCGDISEIPGAVSFLMSDDSSYITGINMPIAGGIL